MYLNKTVALIGGIGATLGLGFLISRALAKPKLVEVQLRANPVKTIILIDDMIEVTTPATIQLKPGTHKFAAVPTTPNLYLTYGFDRWTKNSVAISYSPTAIINITSPCRITAQFIMVEAGVYPIMPELM